MGTSLVDVVRQTERDVLALDRERPRGVERTTNADDIANPTDAHISPVSRRFPAAQWRGHRRNGLRKTHLLHFGSWAWGVVCRGSKQKGGTPLLCYAALNGERPGGVLRTTQ